MPTSTILPWRRARNEILFRRQQLILYVIIAIRCHRRSLPHGMQAAVQNSSMSRTRVHVMSRSLTLLLVAFLLVNACHGFVATRSSFSPRKRTSRACPSQLFLLVNGNFTSHTGTLSDDEDGTTQFSAASAATPDSSVANGAIIPSYTRSLTMTQRRASTHGVLAPGNRNKRTMDLMWCGGNGCKESIRERVVGEDNHMEFEGPATGQVCFMWNDDDQCDLDDDNEESNARTASVLILIKRGDDALMQTAADAVKELTESGVQVYLVPDVAAKIEHYYRVNNDNVKLFEPRTSPGFGGNHVPTSDVWMGELHPHDHMDDEWSGGNPDMICTLGGDGLLMHANVMFQGPVPPILCVAGGSLGFLTPFSRDEMVCAIRVSLGMVRGGEGAPGHGMCSGDDPVAIKPYDALKQSDQYYNGGDDDDEMHNNGSEEGTGDSRPRFSFGLGNRICLSLRMRLECKVINREGVVRARFNVLNEVTVDRGSSPYLAALECFCDNVHLTTVQADGVIFATPTGSTAYSMAAGGSVVHPAVPAILVTPICPHVLSFRSMVFPDSVVLRCYVPDDARADASVAFDGRYRRVLHRGDSVQIQMSKHPMPTINRVDHSADWLQSLKRNFNFNTRARQRPL